MALHTTWTDEEITYLKEHYLMDGIDKASTIILNHTNSAILHKVARLGIIQKSNHIWSSEEERFLIENYASQGAKSIALNLGIEQKKIRNKARQLGLKADYITKCKTWKPDKLKLLNETYSSLGYKECAKLLGLSEEKVKSKAGHLNLKVSRERKREINSRRAKERWSTVSTNARKVDANNFIECKSKEAAYVLGILWADGNLNNKSQHFRICIELVKNDFKEIKPIFLKTGAWCIFSRQRKGKRQSTTGAVVGQMPLYSFLQKNDYEIKSKASADKILSIIPKELHPYWWRGYFDGDGCFYLNKKNNCKQLSLAGSYEQNWYFVESLFDRLNIKYSITRRIQNKKNRSSVVRVTNIEGIKKFGDYIYSTNDEFIGFNRKKNKFLEIVEGYQVSANR